MKNSPPLIISTNPFPNYKFQFSFQIYQDSDWKERLGKMPERVPCSETGWSRSGSFETGLGSSFPESFSTDLPSSGKRLSGKDLENRDRETGSGKGSRRNPVAGGFHRCPCPAVNRVFLELLTSERWRKSVTTKRRPLKEVATCRSRSTELCRKKSSSLFLCFTVFHSFLYQRLCNNMCFHPFHILRNFCPIGTDGSKFVLHKPKLP